MGISTSISDCKKLSEDPFLKESRISINRKGSKIMWKGQIHFLDELVDIWLNVNKRYIVSVYA